jgi:hypothetical protein
MKGFSAYMSVMIPAVSGKNRGHRNDEASSHCKSLYFFVNFAALREILLFLG